MYYNAHNRSKLGKIKKRYSKDVVQSIDPKKLGIDRSYRNWAGKTELLLPLRKNILNPGGADLKLKEIAKASEKAPKEEQKELRKTEKRRNREELQKLDKKEREVKGKQTKNKEQRARLTQEKKKLGKEESKLDERLQKLKKEPQKNAKAIEEDERKKRELQRKQRLAEKKTKSLEEEQKKNQKQQAEIAKQKKEAQVRAEKLARDQKAKQEERTAALARQKELERLKAENERLRAQKEKNLVEDRLLFMRVVRYTKKGHYQNELWYLDANKDDTLFKSPFTKICSRDFTIIPRQGIVVTGYKGKVDNRTDHHLVLLDLKKLKRIKEAKFFVHWRTPLILRNNKLYVFTQKKERYYLSRVSTNFRVEMESKDSINPYSEITFYKNKIFLTGQDKQGARTSIQVFKFSDLSTLKVIKP